MLAIILVQLPRLWVVQRQLGDQAGGENGFEDEIYVLFTLFCVPVDDSCQDDLDLAKEESESFSEEDLIRSREVC